MVMQKILPKRYEAIKVLLDSIAASRGIPQYSLEISAGCATGDGYAGEKHLAVLKGDKFSVHVFIKGAPTDATFQKIVDPRDYFLSEIVFYDNIYPAIKKLEAEKNVSAPFQSIMEVLATNSEPGQEILVLPNARELGYELWERSQQMNGAHAAFVLGEYGKFHAMLYALKDQRNEVYDDLVHRLNPEFNALEKLLHCMGNSLKTLADKARRVFTDPESAIGKQYGKFADSVVDYMMSVSTKSDQYSILTHGDCWFNNMMFKYDDQQNKLRPSKMCLIDFQIVRQSSPVCDISYFIYASCSKDVYCDLDRYLSIYHASFSMHLREMGSDPEKILPFHALKQQWMEYGKYGLVMALMVLKVAVAEKDERIELSDALEEHNDAFIGFTMDYKNDSIYYDRVKILMESAHSLGVL